MSQRSYELVEGGVYAGPANGLDPHFGLAAVGHALVDLVLGLADEGVEQVVQGIFANRLELVGVLRVPRLGTVVVVTLARGARAGRSLWAALGDAAVAGCGLGCSRAVDVGSDTGRARLHAVGGKGLRYGFLRHDGSIDGGACSGGDDLGTQRARGRGVDVAGVPRVLDAVDDGRVAIVGVRARRLALKRVEGSVGARVTTRRLCRRRLGARGNGPRGGSQGAAAGLAGLTRSRRRLVYMVWHMSSSRSSLQERESSYIGHTHRGQHTVVPAHRGLDDHIGAP